MRILSHKIRAVRITPAEAELQIELMLDEETQKAEVRGRLHGPRCEGIQTIEIDYPVKPTTVPRTGRLWIAEPVFWTPERPFRYIGIIELWIDGEKRDETQVIIELRQR